MRLPANKDNIEQCAILLKAGKIIAVPSETVYGLAGNALSESAVRQIFTVKGRPLLDPLICHFPSLEAVSKEVVVSPQMESLAEAFWPGALTIVTQKRKNIPDIVTAGLPSAAVRVPGNPVFRSLLLSLDFPLAAPSANPFGYVSPSRAEQVEQTLGTKIPVILDAGPCQIGIESTILDLRIPTQPAILRYGPIQPEELEQILKIKIRNEVKPPQNNQNEDRKDQLAPGRLSRHYSPNTRVRLIDNGSQLPVSLGQNSAFLLNKRPSVATIEPNLYWLSENGNPESIAYNLFEMLQKLDHLGYQTIIIEKCISKGLGRAINDRLERAAAKS
ncbi:MAG: L-threonylcarbamoyladenylate synthase [Coraliomargaritaceae bacterium]